MVSCESASFFTDEMKIIMKNFIVSSLKRPFNYSTHKLPDSISRRNQSSVTPSIAFVLDFHAIVTTYKLKTYHTSSIHRLSEVRLGEKRHTIVTNESMSMIFWSVTEFAKRCS